MSYRSRDLSSGARRRFKDRASTGNYGGCMVDNLHRKGYSNCHHQPAGSAPEPEKELPHQQAAWLRQNYNLVLGTIDSNGYGSNLPDACQCIKEGKGIHEPEVLEGVREVPRQHLSPGSEYLPGPPRNYTNYELMYGPQERMLLWTQDDIDTVRALEVKRQVASGKSRFDRDGSETVRASEFKQTVWSGRKRFAIHLQWMNKFSK